MPHPKLSLIMQAARVGPKRIDITCKETVMLRSLASMHGLPRCSSSSIHAGKGGHRANHYGRHTDDAGQKNTPDQDVWPLSSRLYLRRPGALGTRCDQLPSAWQAYQRT